VSPPLAGVTVVVTRPRAQAARFATLVSEAGATPLLLPALEIEPVELGAEARARLAPDAFDWTIYTSANSVESALRQLPRPARTRIAAVGRGTARALAAHGLPVHAVPTRSADSEGLLALDAFASVAGRRILILKGEGGRTLLREERIPFTGIQADGPDGVKITLRTGDDADRVAAALRKQDPNVSLETDTLGEGGSVTVRLTPDQIKQRQDFAIQQNITTLRNRVDELGVTEPIVTRQGVDRITVQLPGVQDPNEALRVLGATATLEFRLVDDQNDAAEAERLGRAPLGSRLYKTREGGPVLLKREIIASGEQLVDASSGFSEGQPAVYVKLDARGAAQMLDTTRENLGRPMAVVFIEKKRVTEADPCNGVLAGNECTEEEVISVATIRGVFSSNFQITGLLAGEARELALLLRAGSLAAPLYIVEQRTVGPSLGQDNIERGVRALIIGMLLTFAFMAIYYRKFGLVANLVLMSNVVLLAALLSLLQASLSLPGIAGIVLTVGMAVDANILIFERIREELRNGMSPHAAISAGFEKAFSAIADANVTTLIAGVVLFTFGTGPVRGFAVVLSLGIITSMFTALLGSRAIIHLLWGRERKLEALSI